MKKLVSTILVFCVFISVAGYTIPCTLHCINMNTDVEMHHHQADSGKSCNGSCMVNKVSDKNSDKQETFPSSTILLTQYRVNLTATDTDHNNFLTNPLSFNTYFKMWHDTAHSSWMPDPTVPPPKKLLSV